MSLWRVAVRPRWIAALVLALAVAGAFAALGQWQLERSIANSEAVDRTSETTVPLESVAEPQQPVTEASTGQLVTVEGDFVPGDFMVLEKRLNDGDEGYWVIGHLATDGEAGLAVALGWAESEQRAADALALLDEDAPLRASVTGRYLPSEAPQQGDFESGEFSAMSTAALVNLWGTVDENGVFGGYVVAHEPADGLEAIFSPAPSTDVEVNWLNIFYAAEWVIFAGFAVFLWYRLVKDAWEREEHQRAQVN
ncbi:SURF1 family cytochrome oxidase biogenesis protein [Homoserinimonas sp. A447]